MVAATAAAEVAVANAWPEQEQRLWQPILEHPLDKPGSSLNFTRRLARDNVWSHEFSLKVTEEYKRFVFLAMVCQHPVTPSDQVDQAWHLHLLYSRDYWEVFHKILPHELHHGPTKGGIHEGEKFAEWYSKTLHSYWKWFGVHPPADVWPSALERFQRDTHWLRLNTEDYWLLPKPALWLRKFRKQR